MTLPTFSYKRGYARLLIMIIFLSIAIAAYMYALKIARSVEASMILGQIAYLEDTYHVDKGMYSDSLQELAFKISPPLKFYSISITIPNSSNPQSFLAKAQGNIDGDPDLDIWTIDQDKNLIRVLKD